MIGLAAFLASIFALMMSVGFSRTRNGCLVAGWAWIVTGILLIVQSGNSLAKGNNGMAAFQFLVGVVVAIFINARFYFGIAKAKE